MSRIAPLSGFPEWLPAERVVEQQVLDTVRRVFELHGFASIETRAVEPLEQMLRKGEIDKEVYVLRRLHAESDEADAGLGLHFDLTVPFARYVLQNAGHLEFPFRRYQIQKVWRGERPQEGRFREFTQADIDVIGRDTLAFHHEVEVALVMAEVFRALPCPPAVILVNNRKLAEGFFLGAGATDAAAALRAIDKLDKIGPEKVAALLESDAGLTAEGAQKCLALAGIRSADVSFVAQVRALGVEHELLTEGLDELAAVIAAASARMPGAVVADLKIARGLDYYTGTVYETQLVGYESFGSVCSGGRYDSLASDGRTTYPGVGISLGVSRLLSVLIGRGLVTASRSVPTAVLVAVSDDDARGTSEDVAAALRARGISTEVAPSAAKFGKQIRHADRRGIPFVWFVSDDGTHSVKDIRSGDQVDADPTSWTPPAEDLVPVVALAQNEESTS
ncbi:histidine--tRNA ligase [Longivirga aurantiaca]|uniref:Histidine--tRNA ligase n=1 Tax=Longivirga aurantiaca TaxID=1837743 RepID=A0ABW1T0V6_9ACTN